MQGGFDFIVDDGVKVGQEGESLKFNIFGTDIFSLPDDVRGSVIKNDSV